MYPSVRFRGSCATHHAHHGYLKAGPLENNTYCKLSTVTRTGTGTGIVPVLPLAVTLALCTATGTATYHYRTLVLERSDTYASSLNTSVMPMTTTMLAHNGTLLAAHGRYTCNNTIQAYKFMHV
jgi:hypothetical protein